jgi:hypothetical protein
VVSRCSPGTSAGAGCLSENSAVFGTRDSSVGSATTDSEAFRFLPVAETCLVWCWLVGSCRVIKAVFRPQRHLGCILRRRRGAWRFGLATRTVRAQGCAQSDDLAYTRLSNGHVQIARLGIHSAPVTLIYRPLFRADASRHAPTRSLSRMVECCEDSISENWSIAPCRQLRPEQYTRFSTPASFRSSRR